jgi:cation diffusion facilitator family transporter
MSDPVSENPESARPPSPLPPIEPDNGVALTSEDKLSPVSQDVVFFLPSEKNGSVNNNDGQTADAMQSGAVHVDPSGKQELETLLNTRQEWQDELKKGGCCASKRDRRIKRYYRDQEETIEAIREAENDLGMLNSEMEADADKETRVVSFAAQLSFFLNIGLMLAKGVAAYLSGSLAVISSLVDSVVDLVSGAVIFYTSRATKKTNFASYPFGRTRLEPAAIIIISVVMGLASFQIIVESVKVIAKNDADPEMGWVSIGMVAATIFVKLGLYLFCRRINNPSVETLALDHRNDVVSNAFALLCGWLGTLYWDNIDPIGAIFISLYIAYNWWMTGKDQMQVITGRTAPPNVIKKIVWVASHHDYRIQSIDTARAFHLGSGYITDVHITLDPKMSLEEAHDIGESLQNKLELLSEIEAAFVHLDYENDHRAESEHAFLGSRKRTDSNRSEDGPVTKVKQMFRSRHDSSRSSVGNDKQGSNVNSPVQKESSVPRVSSVKLANAPSSIVENGSPENATRDSIA